MRSWLPWVVLGASCACMALLVVAGEQPWRGEYLWTAEWIEGSLFPAAVIASIALAVSAARAPRSATSICLALVLPAAATFIWAARSWPRWWSEMAGWAVVHFLVSLLGVCAVMMLGFRVARWRPALGPVLTVGLLYLALNGGGLILLGSATGSLLGFEPRPVVLAAQGLAAVVALILAGAIPSGRGWAALPVAALLALSFLLNLEEYRVSRYADTQCTGDPGGLIACSSAQHPRLVDSLAAQMVRLREAARAEGLEDALPTTVVENYPGAQPQPGPGIMGWDTATADLPRGAWIGADAFARQLSSPTHCAAEPPAELRERVRLGALALLESSADIPAGLGEDAQRLYRCAF